MSSPQPNQRAFDFGTTSSFATKNQGGFDFTERKPEEKDKETENVKKPDWEKSTAKPAAKPADPKDLTGNEVALMPSPQQNEKGWT